MLQTSQVTITEQYLFHHRHRNQSMNDQVSRPMTFMNSIQFSNSFRHSSLFIPQNSPLHAKCFTFIFFHGHSIHNNNSSSSHHQSDDKISRYKYHHKQQYNDCRCPISEVFMLSIWIDHFESSDGHQGIKDEQVKEGSNLHQDHNNPTTLTYMYCV